MTVIFAILGGTAAVYCPEFASKKADTGEAGVFCDLLYRKSGGAEPNGGTTEPLFGKVVKNGLAGVVLKDGTEIIGVQVHKLCQLLQSDFFVAVIRHILETGPHSILQRVAYRFAGGAVGEQGSAKGNADRKQLCGIGILPLLCGIQPMDLLIHRLVPLVSGVEQTGTVQLLFPQGLDKTTV